MAHATATHTESVIQRNRPKFSKQLMMCYHRASETTQPESLTLNTPRACLSKPRKSPCPTPTSKPSTVLTSATTRRSAASTFSARTSPPVARMGSSASSSRPTAARAPVPRPFARPSSSSSATPCTSVSPEGRGARSRPVTSPRRSCSDAASRSSRIPVPVATRRTR